MIVNSHTHLEFTGFAYLCPTEPVEFVSWLRTVIATREQRKSTEMLAKQNAIEKGIQALLDAGTTHVGDSPKSPQELGGTLGRRLLALH